MRHSIFDLVGNLDTLIAVTIGAILATTGALFAELIQDRLNRKRRERDAAKFFGEILASIDRILDLTFHSQQFGDPWGPVTRRLFKTAMREAGVYERNRERLFDIHDTNLQARIHTHFLVETFPMEALTEYCDEIDEIEWALSDETPTPPRVEQMKSRLKNLREAREVALERLREEHAKTCPISVELEKIAGVKFSEAVDARGLMQPPRAAKPVGSETTPEHAASVTPQ